MSFYLKLVIIFCVYKCGVRAIPADTLNCGHAKAIFEARNLSTRVPDMAVNGYSLSVCKADHSCCTSDMESNLKAIVKKEYQSLLQHNVQSVQGILASTAIHFQDYVHQMLLKAEKKTLQVLSSTFGSDENVKTFFNELNQYLSNSTDLDNVSSRFQDSKAAENRLVQITNSFFVRVFPLIYQNTLIQKQQELHPEYKACLQNRIAEIKPFAEITKMLEKDISKTFEATRVLITSLNFGSQVLNQSNELILSTFSGQSCYDALLKMTYCNYCSGQSSNVKPCAGYCTNVMRGCLAQPAAEVDSYWNGFYEAVDKLISVVNRGQSLVCLEDLLRSLHSRIAEPIFYFSEHNPSIHNKAKFVCGQARWATNDTSERPSSSGENQKDTPAVIPGVVVSTKLPGNQPDWKSDEEDLNFRSTLLTKKIHQFKESVAKSRGFYANLADSLCADDSFAEKRESAPCWNGQRVAEYTKTVLSIALTSQKYNPEIPWLPQTSPDSKISDLVEKLRYMKQLVLNQIVMNPESDSLYQMNDYGSGSGLSPVPSGQWTDDEDADQDWLNYSGSGDDSLTVTKIPDKVNHDSKTSSGDVTPVPTESKNQNDVKTGSGKRLSLSIIPISISFMLTYRHILQGDC